VRVRVALEPAEYALRVEYRNGRGRTIQLAWTPAAAALDEAVAS